MPEEEKRSYLAIDLKSFYASVECVERGLNPLDTNLVVADAERTEKTICLAVSPSLKKFGVGGRPRLFEVVARMREVNTKRRLILPSKRFTGSSFSEKEFIKNPELKIDYIVAKPRMGLYIDYSTRIFDIYMRFVAPEDIHVYSVDEVFIDVTAYLKTYRLSPHELAMKMIRTVLRETGITATAGIGTNLYLAKVAMDILAKRRKPDKDGVRIAELDEMSYRYNLWNHTPLTDFWRIGRGTANRLAQYGVCTMGDLARLSLKHENDLYNIFGVNAELLIDHAWGYEPVRISDIKSYRPEAHSIGHGQVLSEPYDFSCAYTVALEMAEALAFSLLEKRLLTSKLVLHIGYDHLSLVDPEIRRLYNGLIAKDHYGHPAPVHAHGTANLDSPTSLTVDISEAVSYLFKKIVNPVLLIRRISLTAVEVCREDSIDKKGLVRQLCLFDDELKEKKVSPHKSFEKQRKLQETLFNIKQRFGKNSVLRGLNFADGATQRNRNRQIGGHNE